MKTILITNQPDIAADAQAAGVNRIMVDLESIGKKERQASRNTFISSHSKEDIARVRAVLDSAQLIVRINPWHAASVEEVEYAITHGADIIMLPMIEELSHVTQLTEAVAGRVQCLPLVETAYSMQHIQEIVAIPDINEVYIGLNDLHLSLGQDFLFEPLAEGQLDAMASKINAAGVPFGFGGIAAMGSGELPAEKILAEHQRLGSSWVILSSRFCKDIVIKQKEGRKNRITQALAAMQATYQQLQQRTPQRQQEDYTHTARIIRRIAAELKQKRQAV